MFGTKPINTDVLSRLSINIQNITDSPETNSYIKGYINTIAELDKNLGKILTDKTASLQEKLEKLSEINHLDLEKDLKKLSEPNQNI